MNEITVEMIKDMKHCIGFEKNRVTGGKHGTMHAYRNRYVDSIDNSNWNYLIELGLADRSLQETTIGCVMFYLTSKGFQFLADFFNFKSIVEIK